MSAAEVFEEVSESFAILRRECTIQYQAIAGRLTNWPVLLTIDAQSVSFSGVESTVQIGKLGAIESHWVHISTDSECIRLVANGHATLAEAVEGEGTNLRIRGPVDGVAAAFDSIADYVDAALRCPDLETKLDRFLEDEDDTRQLRSG